MGERRPGLAAVVDDRLGVADVGVAGVLLDAVAQRRHHQPGLLVVEVGPAAVVVGGQHEHLVGAAGPGLGEHRAEVLDGEGVVAGEGRVEVRDDPHEPVALGAVASRPPAGSPPRCRGRTGTAATGPASIAPTRGAKSAGRTERSMATVTQRPVSGLSRSWLMARSLGRVPSPDEVARTARYLPAYWETCTASAVENGRPSHPDQRSTRREAAGRGEVVELLGREVAEHPRPQADAALAEFDVLSVHHLFHRPVGAQCEHHAVELHRSGLEHGLGRRQEDRRARKPPPASRPPGASSAGGGLEACLLGRHRGQQEERVERGHDEREPVAGAGPGGIERRYRVGHVAEDGAHRGAARPGGETIEHRRRRVESPHLDPGGGERHRQAAAADAELEHAAATGGRHDPGHRGVEVVDVAVPVVVDVGEGVAVGRRSVAVHPSIVALGRWRGW